MTAAPALSTLHHVTERKLKKLADNRQKFEADKKSILAKVASAPDPRQKVEALIAGFELHGIEPQQPDVSIPNLERFVHQAKHDPSVSTTLLRDWQSKLEHELDIMSAKYQYAALFGHLVIEWIKHPNPAASPSARVSVDTDMSAKMTDSFDPVGRKEMVEQRQEWEGYAFTEKKMDQAKIEAYLYEIFATAYQSKKMKKSPLRKLRDAMENVMDFKSDLQTPKKEDEDEDEDEEPVTIRGEHENRFTVENLKACIRGVIQADLFAGQKREALADLEHQPAVLDELVDVLNMDLESLDTWEWDPSPVPLHMRRQLNGKYRVYMDEETLQAILLHFIGETWAAAMKKAFTTFIHSGAWRQTPHQSMGRTARSRREYFVPDSTKNRTTVRNHRRETYQKDYFMMQLPDKPFKDYHNYAADDVQDKGQDAKTKSQLATKQSMLRLVTTEVLLNTKVYGECVVLQSDFAWHGPSHPHDTIFAVLNFFGVPAKWLRFFKKFLEAPVAFAMDGPDGSTTVRKCGIPMSHVLSDALSEAVLFCLDFAVNKRTQGANIYRFHDDLWFWGQESTCIQAWKVIQEFNGVMGLNLNEEKTGSALVVADKAKSRPLAESLPLGKIKWGFLLLDSEAGKWVIDRSQVDEHIEELRLQLGACRSVMAWVQAWNSYVTRFFSTNFGQPAHCFGRQHNDMIISTFEHIQRSLFADTGTTNVTDHLRRMVSERFTTDDTIPDGFFYFPAELGGLGLRNPLINAFATYNNSVSDSGHPIDWAFGKEEEQYRRLKEAWKTDIVYLKAPHSKRRHKAPDAKANAGNNKDNDDNDTDAELDEPFFGLDEFTRYKEECSAPLHEAYTALLRCPPETLVDSPDQEEQRKALLAEGLADSHYWRWIFTLYAGDLKQRFGGSGLQLGKRDLLPVGLVDVLRSEKVRWQG
ncbi:hypothetical protein K504DRAFT_403524 [Pleomassaria siparia CBS 279.74]|uniref:Uncharacterized protein n=1 Tax=Pleomassaria siparia CBS 279.74 TaxID=1314801 RepID=A0A6G1KCZ6_9PLEO|nr:hypothetical protein K504DRAFT_403524 [Pleomassaria siparia CBS 279.74]